MVDRQPSLAWEVSTTPMAIQESRGTLLGSFLSALTTGFLGMGIKRGHCAGTFGVIVPPTTVPADPCRSFTKVTRGLRDDSVFAGTRCISLRYSFLKVADLTVLSLSCELEPGYTRLYTLAMCNS